VTLVYQRCNGFRIRGLNQDCDRLAIQSSECSTWVLGYKRRMGIAQWQERALGMHELVVLRAYGGEPRFEIEALGDKAGLMKINPVRQYDRYLRVGSKLVVELGLDESCVLKCELIQYPRSSGVAPGAYGPGLQV